MGLYVHTLGEIPATAERAYYVYLLDYGWEEGLGNAVRANLPRMADMASRSEAVVIHGPRGVHFEDEVLSWHRVNIQVQSRKAHEARRRRSTGGRSDIAAENRRGWF